MLSSSRLRGGGDNDKDKKVPQWDCKKGPSFERTRREVRVFASGYYCSPNDDFNVWDAYMGSCMGGDELFLWVLVLQPRRESETEDKPKHGL